MGKRNLDRGAMRKDATAVCLAFQTRDQVGRDVCERGHVTGGVGCLASLLICHDAPRAVVSGDKATAGAATAARGT